MRSIKLHRLLDLVGIIPSLDLIDKEINNISFNSREVQKGTLFLGMPGLNVDGGKYCIEAIENGAEAAIIGPAAKQKVGSIDRVDLYKDKYKKYDIEGPVIAVEGIRSKEIIELPRISPRLKDDQLKNWFQKNINIILKK